MTRKITTHKIVFTGVLAAIVCVVTLFRFPLLGSKVHFANAMCLLSGLMMGGVYGGLAAGIGSAVYDAALGGYDAAQCVITFATKFLMAWLCGHIAWGRGAAAAKHGRNAAACVSGAVFYVLLYMLKTFVYQRFVYGFPADAVWVTMLSKLPASCINAAVAIIVAPILWAAIRPALSRGGILEKIAPRPLSQEK